MIQFINDKAHNSSRLMTKTFAILKSTIAIVSGVAFAFGVFSVSIFGPASTQDRVGSTNDSLRDALVNGLQPDTTHADAPAASCAAPVDPGGGGSGGGCGCGGSC
ncbi:MAG: hypothetical protein JWO50_365 [Candidatus Kaiserbacteria bacterium]|nr:hypothetical protein [Candidatus Kaiserbacteria bacterium]